MNNYILKIQYNGSNYYGYQKQIGKKTIQEEVEKALSKLFEKEIEVIGCSRTDRGVSAYEYVLNFFVDTKLPAERICYKVNRFLPNDIKAFESFKANDNFHSRNSLKSKTYIYQFYVSNHTLPLLNRTSYQVDKEFNLELAEECCKLFIGKHDFNAFRNISSEQPANYMGTIKEVYNSYIYKDGDVYCISVTADNYLYNMIRIMSSVVIDVGTKKIDISLVKKMLEDKKKLYDIYTLPPKALYLKKVNY